MSSLALSWAVQPQISETLPSARGAQLLKPDFALLAIAFEILKHSMRSACCLCCRVLAEATRQLPSCILPEASFGKHDQSVCEKQNAGREAASQCIRLVHAKGQPASCHWEELGQHNSSITGNMVQISASCVAVLPGQVGVSVRTEEKHVERRAEAVSRCG